MKFILGSASPRRKQLLGDLGLKFESIPADIDETPRPHEPALKFVRRLAKEKALASAALASLRGNVKRLYVLSADTIVVKNGKILGKPESRKHALKMLKSLSGSSHTVITAWSWLEIRNGRMKQVIGHCSTKVTFDKRSETFWNWYITTGEPMDKAGAYAAQGIGMSFIKSVSGSYSNVVGLPLTSVLESFKQTYGTDLDALFGKHRK